MLRQILDLPHGIPSHDTFNRVFSLLNPRRFERLFMEWAKTLKGSGVPENVIAVDGKTVRGSKDSFHQTSPIHLVHAWNVANNICLGQLKTGDKSNEITAIPELLDLLEMKNSIITIDAMHWSVENSLHWTQDMVFREDGQRKWIRHAPENFAVIRKIALNLLKKDTGKESLRSKRLKAAWNTDFLLHLLKI
jgi:predicted transposase YbfD/YdcC